MITGLTKWHMGHPEASSKVHQFKMASNRLAVVARTFNPSTWEVEAGRSLSMSSRSAPGLQSEFQDRPQSYTQRNLVLKRKIKQNNTTNKLNCMEATDIKERQV